MDGLALLKDVGIPAFFAIVFWLETVAVLAFATSWLVKGESLKPLEKLTRKMMSDTPGPGAAR